MTKDKTDRLEHFVLNHREEFEQLKPNQSVWTNIGQGMDEHDKSSKTVSFMLFFKRTAAAVVLMLALYGAYHLAAGGATMKKSVNVLTSEEMAQNSKLKELFEAQLYYSHQVSNKMQQLENYCKDFPIVCSEVMEETRAMESEMKQLKGDLKENVGNERVLEAMVRNYRIKLRIMEDLLESVKRVKSNENNIDDQDMSEVI